MSALRLYEVENNEILMEKHQATNGFVAVPSFEHIFEGFVPREQRSKRILKCVKNLLRIKNYPLKFSNRQLHKKY